MSTPLGQANQKAQCDKSVLVCLLCNKIEVAPICGPFLEPLTAGPKYLIAKGY